MMQRTDISLHQRNFRLLKLGLPFVLAFVAISTVPNVILDLHFSEKDNLYWLTYLFSTALNYLLLVKLMRLGGFLESGKKQVLGLTSR